MGTDDTDECFFCVTQVVLQAGVLAGLAHRKLAPDGIGNYQLLGLEPCEVDVCRAARTHVVEVTDVLTFTRRIAVVVFAWH